MAKPKIIKIVSLVETDGSGIELYAASGKPRDKQTVSAQRRVSQHNSLKSQMAESSVASSFGPGPYWRPG